MDRSQEDGTEVVTRIITQVVVTPEVVNAKECAVIIGMPYDTFRKLAADHAWRDGDLPAPTSRGRGSGKKDRFGERGGQRGWRLVTIERWLASHEYGAK